MNQVVYTILYIVLFILCLSVLIVIHELGHLTFAKVFKVYCYEFSIGMGPALLHKRKKGHETYFSIRAIPFGGYVSMYGEGAEPPDGEVIDPSRSLTSIKKWKRAIIMVAGVTMNALLALVIFFSCEMGFTKQWFNGINVVQVQEGSPAALSTEGGIKDEDKIDCFLDTRKTNYIQYDSQVEFYDKDDVLLSNNNVIVLNASNISFNEREYFGNLELYKATTDVIEEKYTVCADYSKPVNFTDEEYNNVSYIKTNFKSFEYIEVEGQDPQKVLTDHVITLNVLESNDAKKLENCGLSTYLFEHDNTFGEAVVCTFEDFGNSATAVFRGIAGLFTSAEAWKSTSGIIGIGFTLSNYLKNYGWRMFIYMWGLISVNLAIFNLLPFPGLDGWHLIVLAIEGITHKEIPTKVKNIISAIGVVLLLVLMIAIVFKDIFALIL